MEEKRDEGVQGALARIEAALGRIERLERMRLAFEIQRKWSGGYTYGNVFPSDALIDRLHADLREMGFEVVRKTDNFGKPVNVK